jgi:hypothetical protein
MRLVHDSYAKLIVVALESGFARLSLNVTSLSLGFVHDSYI